MVEPERVPETRMRHAVATTLRYYVQPTNTALIGAYRFYRDDWNVQAHAPEIRIVQELLGDDMELHLSYRFYRQRAAEFYKKVYNTNDMSVEPYLTDDDKLSHVRSHNAGIKLSLALGRLGITGSWSEARIEGLFQYLKQNTRFGDAVISQPALTVPLEY